MLDVDKKELADVLRPFAEAIAEAEADGGFAADIEEGLMVTFSDSNDESDLCSTVWVPAWAFEAARDMLAQVLEAHDGD